MVTPAVFQNWLSLASFFKKGAPPNYTTLFMHGICAAVVAIEKVRVHHSGQSYKGSTIVNYDSRVILVSF